MARHAQSLFLFPVATLVPTPPAAMDAVEGDGDADLPTALRPVPGELVIDLDTYGLLEGPPSFELVDACSRAPFHAAPATRDLDGTWQYVSPRLRATTALTSSVRVVYLDAIPAAASPR